MSATLATALVAAALAGVPAEGGERVVSVALDLTGLDAEAYRRVGGLALEKQAVLRLVQEQFGVVAPAAGPDVAIRIELGDQVLRLTARSRRGAEVREVALGAGEALSELHLEASQKIVELARAVTPPPPVQPGPPPPPPPREAPRTWTLDGGVGGEALLRDGGTDPQARLQLRWGGRLGVRLSGAYAPSGSSELRVLEWAVQVGPSYRQPLGAALDLEVDLLGGVLLHHYTLWDGYASDRAGDRIDWAASLPLTLCWRPFSALAVSLRIAGRLAGNQREHFFNERELWRRGAWGLEAGMLVGARF